MSAKRKRTAEMSEKYCVVTPGGGFGEFYDDADDAIAEAKSKLPVAGVLPVHVPDVDPEPEEKSTNKKTGKK